MTGGRSRNDGSRRYRRGAALLSIGIGASGLLTYAYFALASHELSPDSYGNLVLLWSVLFISVVTLYTAGRAVRLTQSGRKRCCRHSITGSAIRVAATIQVALAAGYVVIALSLRGPIEDGLLSGDETLYRILVLAAPAYAVSFFARGYLAGSGRLRALRVDAPARGGFPLRHGARRHDRPGQRRLGDRGRNPPGPADEPYRSSAGCARRRGRHRPRRRPRSIGSARSRNRRWPPA